jgi:outer membrane protein OmpA-like peptidoglycan-associated protein
MLLNDMKHFIQIFFILLLLGKSVSAKTVNSKHFYKDSTVVIIPFEYKQSALYYAYTYEVIDSIVNLLFKNKAITISINGYVYPDEGNDTICKYLSLNRALFVRDYIIGRGIETARIFAVKGMGKTKPTFTATNKQGIALNCRAEIILNYPLPPPPPFIADIDEDGIVDSQDGCINKFGYADNNGCPDSNAIIIPFQHKQAWLSLFTYTAMDSVVAVLRQHPAYTIFIEGHAYKTEGLKTFCNTLSNERALVVKKYLLSRNVLPKQILKIVFFADNHPLNAGKNPEQEYANCRVQIFIKKNE